MARRKITWAPDAKAKLVGTLKFYAKRNGNKKYSEWIYFEIKRRLRMLQQFPYLGHQGSNDTSRIIPFSYFGILYEVKQNEIIVLSFWDFRRDPIEREDDKR